MLLYDVAFIAVALAPVVIVTVIAMEVVGYGYFCYFCS